MIEKPLDHERKVQDLRKRFLAVNKDLAPLLHSEGMLISYRREDDYLYVTFGIKPRESMGLELGDVTVFVDPESMQATGVEIPFFLERLNAGRLKGWELPAKWLQESDTILIPPSKQIQSFIGNLVSDLTHRELG